MKNENLSIGGKKKIRKFLIKYDITDEKISETRQKILGFWNKGENIKKPTIEEKERLAQLKYFYKRSCDEDLDFAEKIFKLLKELLNSSNPKIARSALEIAEKLVEKYRQTTVDILQSLPNKK